MAAEKELKRAKLTLEIPDDLLDQVKLAGHSVETILLKALTQYLANIPPRDIVQTRTWQLCGGFSVSETTSINLLSENTDVIDITNYAEQVDDILYQGF